MTEASASNTPKPTPTPREVEIERIRQCQHLVNEPGASVIKSAVAIIDALRVEVAALKAKLEEAESYQRDTMFRYTQESNRATELAARMEALENEIRQHMDGLSCGLCDEETDALMASTPAADLAAFTERIRRETVARIVDNLGFCHGGIWPLDERHGTGRGENGDPNGPEEECGPWSALMADDKSAIYRAAGLAPHAGEKGDGE